jgi:hypothetical protein
VKCPGLRSLGIIAGLGVATLVAYKAMPWAAARIWWIGGTVAACAGLAVASCLWLARRAVVCVSGFGAPRAIAAGRVRAEVVEPERPAVAPPRPPLGPPPKSWLCETCYWAWPLDLPFCGICGHSRSVTGAEREVVIRQAVAG